MRDLQWLADKAEYDKIIGFGLGIEPNSFTAYFYEDLHAETLLGFKSYPSLKESFQKDIVGLSPIYALGFDLPWTLLPLAHFDRSECASYLKFTTAASERTQIGTNELIGSDTALIFGQSEHWNTFLPFLPGIEIRHGVGALIAAATRIANRKLEPLALLHLAGKQATLLIVEPTKLQFANAITFEHLEDIRYFFFYTLQQLGIGNEIKTYLFGEASAHLGLQQLFAPYLSSISTNIPKEILPENTELIDSTSATHWLGLTAATCVL